MPEWLVDAWTSEGTVPAPELLARLGLALALGTLIAEVHRWTRRRANGEAYTLFATLVLLTVLISLVTVVIGNSVARAFSLVGALSIVRFRTVVEDTRDTAFVIFAVATGMTIGTGLLLAAVLATPVVGLAAVLLYFWERPPRSVPSATLQVRIGVGLAPEQVLGPTLEEHLVEVQLVGVATARQGAALELTYRVRCRDAAGLVPLVGALNRCEGVQGVEASSKGIGNREEGRRG